VDVSRIALLPPTFPAAPPFGRPIIPVMDALTAVAIAALGLAIVSAAGIAGDIARGYRQRMAVMDVVWPVTALYLGPLAAWAYVRWGRPESPRWQRERGSGPGHSMPVAVAVAVSHCGAGCTIGDIVGSSVVFLLGLGLAGLGLWAELPVDFALAYGLGIAFQYFAIAPVRDLGLRDGIVAAVRADTLSLSAFEVGMFGWMILVQLVVFPVRHLHPDALAFWFFMQVGMILGFVTAYPVNWWLVQRGFKERM